MAARHLREQRQGQRPLARGDGGSVADGVRLAAGASESLNVTRSSGAVRIIPDFFQFLRVLVGEPKPPKKGGRKGTTGGPG